MFRVALSSEKLNRGDATAVWELLDFEKHRKVDHDSTGFALGVCSGWLWLPEDNCSDTERGWGAGRPATLLTWGGCSVTRKREQQSR